MFFIVIIIAFIVGLYNSDRFKNPEEYKDAGSAGERIIYTTLRDKIRVPERQILRTSTYQLQTEKRQKLTY